MPDQTPETRVPVQPPLRPIQPRPRLFYSMCVLFALWIAMLVWIYAKTVYPLRYGADATKSVTR